MKTSNEIDKIIPTLLEVQSIVKSMKKDSSGYGYKYISFDYIINAIKPVLNKHGLLLMQNVSGDMIDGCNVTGCETIIYHTSGQWISSDKLIVNPVATPTQSEKAKGIQPIPTVRDLGSAITYAKRYQLCGLLGIVADMDDDGAVNELHSSWGLIVSDKQKSQISNILKEKPHLKEKYGEIMHTVAPGKMATNDLTSEEADKLIIELNKM